MSEKREGRDRPPGCPLVEPMRMFGSPGGRALPALWVGTVRRTVRYAARSASTPYLLNCGSPGGRALPYIFPNLWPFFWRIDQAGSHWVHADVVGFFNIAFICTKAVVEKIALPLNSKLRSTISLKVSDGFFHANLRGKADDAVEMIEH